MGASTEKINYKALFTKLQSRVEKDVQAKTYYSFVKQYPLLDMGFFKEFSNPPAFATSKEVQQFVSSWKNRKIDFIEKYGADPCPGHYKVIYRVEVGFGTMEKGYGNTDTKGIVNLIPSSTTVESGDTGRKRKMESIVWSDIEETKIWKFPYSTYISSGGLSDLNEQLHESKEESCHRSNEVNKDYLSSSLETALNSIATSETAKKNNCAMFEKALLDIIQFGSCYTLAKDAFDLVNIKAKELLLKIAKVSKDSDALESNFKMLCWLFKILLNARGAKELVVHMLLISDLSSRLSIIFNGRALELFRDFKWTFKWTRTMLSIFEEVLAGRLLLKSSMRVDLFHEWEWLFEALFLNKDKDGVLVARLAKTLSSFMMTLPHEYQTTLLKGWLSRVDNDDTCMLDVLELAQSMWIKDLQRHLVALESACFSETVAKTTD